MERYHKSYRIISRSDRDPESNFFRALVTIEIESRACLLRKYAPCCEAQWDDSIPT